MKITEEIAEKIHAWVDNVMFCEHNGQPSLTEPTVEQLTTYLDAKLGPVKKALVDLRAMTTPDDCTCYVCEAADKAIIMLSDTMSFEELKEHLDEMKKEGTTALFEEKPDAVL